MMNNNFILICKHSFFIIHITFYNSCQYELPKEKNPSYFIYENEIALIYIGCSNCSAAMNKEIPNVFKDLVFKLDSLATSNNFGFTTIGISNETNISFGINHLQNIYDFDEISVGNGLANRGFQHYFWKREDTNNSLFIPQFIITHRTYSKDTVNQINPEIFDELIKFQALGIIELYLLLRV